jgi:carboxymethylenebutenolidase
MASWIETTVDGSAMRNYVTGEQGSNGVVICMHAPGVDESMQELAGWSADAGFQSVTPDLYHRQPDDGTTGLEKMAHLKDDEVLADIASGVSLLKSRGAPQVAVIGFCMGGRISYLQAAADPSMTSAVVFYGGNIMKPWGDNPTPFERTADISCPVLGLFGGQDTNPSPEDVIRIEAALREHGKNYEFHSYADAGHAFLNSMRPSYRPESGADAWRKCTEWLEQHFTQPGQADS